MWLIYKTISSSLCKASKVNQMHDNLIQGLQRDSRLPFYYCLFKCFQKSVWGIWQTSWTVRIFVCKSVTSIQFHMDVTTLQKFWLFKPHSPPLRNSIDQLWGSYGYFLEWYTACSSGIRDWRILHLFHRILCLTFGSPWLFFIQTWSLFQNILL